MKSITETFGYDSQNRLTGVWPHAMDAATTAEGVFPATAQTVAYTSFDKVSKVKQGNDSLCYTYGYDHQRIFMEEQLTNPMTGGLINPMAGGLFKIMKGGLLNWWFLEDYEKY